MLSRAAGIFACTVASLLLATALASAQSSLGLRGPVEETAPSETYDPFEDDLSTPELEATPSQRAPLESEEDGTASNTRAQPFILDDELNARTPRENTRIGAIEGLARTPEQNPYAALGLRAGSFIVTPTLEQGLTATTNASSSAGGGRAILSDTTLRLNAVSDWSRHSASLQAEGSYRKSLSGESISEIVGSMNGDLRLDLGAGFAATAGLGYRISPESASSPVNLGNVTSRPNRHSFSGSAGISRNAGLLGLALTGALTRDVYEDASLAGGGTLSQRDRNTTLATATLRAGYELSPALNPFVEGEIGRRFYDQTSDANGYARSANRYGLRAGVELDMGEKLSGELSAGWLTERPDDRRLAAISGPSVAGRLAWSPQRGTTVELNGSTNVETTTTSGETGSLLYSGSVAISRDIRANLTGRALAGIDWRNYNAGDRDLIMRGEASLTWWLNRNAGITTRARHEVQQSSRPGRNYDATSIFLGMTLQR